MGLLGPFITFSTLELSIFFTSFFHIYLRLTNLPLFQNAIATLALTAVTVKLISFAKPYLRKSSLQRYHHNAPGSTWALVTGASDGIGYGFAEALCSNGFNVLLHGRSQSKLATVKSTLLEKYPHIQIQTVAADAFTCLASDIENIVAVARALPGALTILINNVGGSPLEPMFGALAAVDAAHTDNLINLNLRFPSQLTRALLPLLVDNSPALVMNITSALALRGLPYLSIYSASKSFNYTFGEALRAEMMAEGHDVEVLGIVVGNVTSGRNKVHVPLITCDSGYMAEVALRRVGCGRANVWGWWRHAVQWEAMALLPEAWVERLMVGVMKDRKEGHEREQMVEQTGELKSEGGKGVGPAV